MCGMKTRLTQTLVMTSWLSQPSTAIQHTTSSCSICTVTILTMNCLPAAICSSRYTNQSNIIHTMTAIYDVLTVQYSQSSTRSPVLAVQYSQSSTRSPVLTVQYSQSNTRSPILAVQYSQSSASIHAIAVCRSSH